MRAIIRAGWAFPMVRPRPAPTSPPKHEGAGCGWLGHYYPAPPSNADSTARPSCVRRYRFPRSRSTKPRTSITCGVAEVTPAFCQSVPDARQKRNTRAEVGSSAAMSSGAGRLAILG